MCNQMKYFKSAFSCHFKQKGRSCLLDTTDLSRLTSFRLILYMIKPKLMSFRIITWRRSNIQEHQDLLQSHHRCACDSNPNPRGLLAYQHANHYWQDCQ